MTYKLFANIYDKLMYDFDYEKVYFFIDKVYSSANLKNKTVLELGCGTGNLTEKLIKNFTVDAVDISADMLAILSNKISSSNLRVFNHNMVDFKSDRLYSMVLSCCDSVNYIRSSKDIERLFENTFNQLEDEGIFIFDLNTENKFISMENTYVDEVEDVFYVWENFYDVENKENTYSINFFVRKNNLYERFYEEHVEKVYSNKFIVDTLKSVGFKSIEVYIEYEFNLEINNSNRLVYVARR